MTCYKCKKEGHLGGHCPEPSKFEQYVARLDAIGLTMEAENEEELLEEFVCGIEEFTALMQSGGPKKH